MQSTSTQSRSLGRPSPPSRRVKVSDQPGHALPKDSFVRTKEEHVNWKAALLAGISLFGVASCARQPEPEPQVQVPVATWPEGEFMDIDLSGISLQHTTATSQDIKKAVDWALDHSFKTVPNRPDEDRHALGRRIQTQDSQEIKYDGSELVVIAFEGTGGYHPRKAQIVQDAAAKLREQDLRVDGTSGSLSRMVANALDERDGVSSGWSGLARGPLEQLIRDPKQSSRTQWFSFASEEVEALSGFDAFQRARLSEVLVDSLEIYMGETPGIENALRAIREIRSQAAESGKNPQFLLVSHSSGGRSMVKFLEKAKSITEDSGKPMIFPSALTIDPVRGAHEAFFEGSKELLNKGTEHNFNKLRTTFGFSPKEVYPPLIRHRDQPESLYRPSNLKYLLNYFQVQDTEGLKVSPLVGIQGSRMKDAVNLEIADVGTGGHGEIAVHQDVRDAFMNQVEELLAK
jgi:hypothetical protein